MSTCPQDNPHPAPRASGADDRPKPCPGFYLVKLPPEAVASATPSDMAFLARDARGMMRRVDQGAMLVSLLLDSPVARTLATQVLNDPDNPKWQEMATRAGQGQ